MLGTVWLTCGKQNLLSFLPLLEISWFLKDKSFLAPLNPVKSHTIRYVRQRSNPIIFWGSSFNFFRLLISKVIASGLTTWQRIPLGHPLLLLRWGCQNKYLLSSIFRIWHHQHYENTNCSPVLLVQVGKLLHHTHKCLRRME